MSECPRCVELEAKLALCQDRLANAEARIHAGLPRISRELAEAYEYLLAGLYVENHRAQKESGNND